MNYPVLLSFKVTLPGDVAFNRRLRLDLCVLKDNNVSFPILHIVDTATHLQDATFLTGEDSVSVWAAFCMCWSRLYVGDPEEILTDAGSCFTSPFFEQTYKEHEISLKHTNVESQTLSPREKLFITAFAKFFTN